jgi:thiamine-monophosphate kinase
MTEERQLIERIRRKLAAKNRFAGVRGLILGVGDDAALLRGSPGRDWVLSCDAFLENVHFLPNLHPPEAVGYKSLARAASDLAAMGAAPRFFLLTLALPGARTGSWLNRFLRGLRKAEKRFQFTLIGGDTSELRTVAISITVLGEVPAGRATTRAGARPGNLLYVSGRLGAAQLGLELMLRGRRRRWPQELRKHLYPEPRLALGQWLARRRLASAMIDVSDGLSTDLHHIAEASQVGARIWRERIPAVALPRELRGRGFDPLRLALHGGEDYELLFTVPRRLVKKIPSVYRGVPLTPIGEMTRKKGVWLMDAAGRATRLEPRGWDPFRPR